MGQGFLNMFRDLDVGGQAPFLHDSQDMGEEHTGDECDSSRDGTSKPDPHVKLLMGPKFWQTRAWKLFFLIPWMFLFRPSRGGQVSKNSDGQIGSPQHLMNWSR